MTIKHGARAAAAFSIALLAALPAGGADTESLARALVNDCAGIQAGDVVLVHGGVRDAMLLEDVAINVRKLGAFPIITLGSDRLTRGMFDDVPAAHDSQAPQAGLRLAEIIDAEIAVDYGETIGLLKHVPPERLHASSKADQQVMDKLLARNVRQVRLGNGLTPTAALAEQYGITLETLEAIYWGGVNTDYRKLEATGETVRQAFAAGRAVRLTNPNGTDFEVRIEGRKVFVSDGVISAEDRKRGGAACQVWLPAGEVYLSVVPGTAKGRIVVDRQYHRGSVIEGLTLAFESGKLTSMTAKSGLDPLKAEYDAAGPGKERFAFLDVGINPDVAIPPGSAMVAWMPAGMVSIGIGGDAWAGGDNDSAYGLNGFLPGSTLTIDGKAIVENGKLVIPPPARMGF